MLHIAKLMLKQIPSHTSMIDPFVREHWKDYSSVLSCWLITRNNKKAIKYYFFNFVVRFM